MACNSGCQSGCYKDDHPAEGDDRHRKHTVAEEVGISILDGDSRGHGLCIKCKVNETIAESHPSVAGSNVESGRFCADCFRSNLFGKFRFAVTSNAMILPSDNVLVAFSGGTSSRVALQFVHEMQVKAQKNFDASRDRSLPVFGVGVAYIDESVCCNIPASDSDEAINEMKKVVSCLVPPAKSFHFCPAENIYLPDCTAGRNHLTELVNAVNDATGKEDLLEHLRMLSLQKIATENGYTKLVLGTCTSRIACRVLEATVKGKGFSLAADIQYVDARWEIPVVLPLRDCLSEELNMLCRLDSLKTVEAFQRPLSGINELISSFVKLLREENPSRESTIVRTAAKLTPFSFNMIPEVGDDDSNLASLRRQKKYNLKTIESLPPESFCLICHSPLKNSSNSSLNGFSNGDSSSFIHAAACSSCQFQILPRDPSSLEYFYSLLPQQITAQSKDSRNNQELLREQIQDFLLTEGNDFT